MNSQEEARIKRSRVPNFTAHEKSLLVRLINKRKDIIENKLTDGKTIARKKDAWILVEKEFNAEPNVYKRDLLVLKRAWDNLKAVTRRLRARQRGNLIRPEKARPAQSPGPQQEDIINMVEEATAPSLNCEVYNNFDSEEGAPENMSISNNQSSSEEIPFKNVPAPEVIVCEPNSPFQTESIDVNDANVSKHHLPPSHTRASHYVQREAALRLKSLQIKSRIENQILRAKLKTALLQQQEAEIRVETAKVELELKKSLMKAEL